MPKVSVIIPVYNKEMYLKESIGSVINQSFRDLEIIVVNDGSTDKSLELLEKMAKMDTRIQIIDIPNGGVSNARNIGLGYAKGDWIQFLDADDFLEPEFLTKVVCVAENYNVEIVFSGFTMVDSKMNPLKEIFVQETGIKNQKELCHYFIKYQYNNGYFGYISNKFFKRVLWEKSGAKFPVGTTLAEDLDFYARLYPSVESAYFWEGKSFYYLQTESNYTHNAKIDYYSQLEIHLDIKRWFQKSGVHLQYKDQLYSKITQYVAYILFYTNEENKDLIKAYSVLRNRKEVIECIDKKYIKGFNRKIISALKKGNLSMIKTLFWVRNSVRVLYRGLKKHV